MRKINWLTLFSILVILVGIVLYIGWGVTYNVWYDIGIYSITIVFVSFGVLGTIFSLIE